jgi:hypothetical protein
MHENFTNDVKTSSPKSKTCKSQCCLALVVPCANINPRTPGEPLEAHLNTHYGPGTPFYEDTCSLTRKGVEEGWAANIEIEGQRYRRSKIALPQESTRFFSITTVHMESEGVFSGQYHAHPYGEINCVVQIDELAELMGGQGWQGAGWTSPGPGTHHYPQVRGGALVALFFLPAGRIDYGAKPGDAQPASL